MTKIYEVKPHKNFKTEVEIPGSKSVANRALIIAAQAKGKTIVFMEFIQLKEPLLLLVVLFLISFLL